MLDVRSVMIQGAIAGSIVAVIKFIMNRLSPDIPFKDTLVTFVSVLTAYVLCLYTVYTHKITINYIK